MKFVFWLFLLLTVGCSTVPPTNVHQPMTARPAPRNEMANGNGAIYQAASSRPLFEDRRARFVGDTITVTIKEKTQASSDSNNKFKKDLKEQSASISTLGGSSASTLANFGLKAKSLTDFEGGGKAANNNSFEGDMTVTVIDVMPNGNLLVSGEKQLAVGVEQEFVRVSGVINPSFIGAFNTIESSRIADARIEYKSSGQVADSTVMGWLARFFLNVMPF